ncbi:unnamed protein product, partial [Polarella glacialis]
MPPPAGAKSAKLQIKRSYQQFLPLVKQAYAQNLQEVAVAKKDLEVLHTAALRETGSSESPWLDVLWQRLSASPGDESEVPGSPSELTVPRNELKNLMTVV